MNRKYHVSFSFAEMNRVLTSLYNTQREKQEIYRQLINSNHKEDKTRYEKDLETIQNAIDQIKKAEYR